MEYSNDHFTMLYIFKMAVARSNGNQLGPEQISSDVVVRATLMGRWRHLYSKFR